MKPGVDAGGRACRSRDSARRSDEALSRERADARTSRSCRCSASCSATRGRRCGPCWLRCWCCLPWPAPTSVVSCSCGVRRERTTLPFVWRSARTRRHVIGEALAESTVLMAVSGVLGVVLAVGLVRAVRAAAPGNIPGIADVSIDWRVLAFALIVTGASIALCVDRAVVAVAVARRAGAAPAGRPIAGGEGGRARRALAGIEIALAVFLLVMATLVTRTLLNLRAVDVGFNADRILAFDVPQPTSRYPDARASQEFADRLLAAASRRCPECERAASVLLAAALGRGGHGLVGDDRRAVADRRCAESIDEPRSRVARLLRDDGDSAPRRARHQRRRSRRARRRSRRQREFRQALLARWPSARATTQVSAAGLAIRSAVVHRRRDRRRCEVPRARGSRLDLYISSAQCPYPVHQFVVRTATGRPDSIVGAVRAEVRALDAALPIDDVVVLSDAVQSQIANPRLVALALNGFATTASALAALGLGTLIAWQVRLRTREIGVRLALGATPRQVIAHRDGRKPSRRRRGSWRGARWRRCYSGGFLETLLFEVAPHDPVSVIWRWQSPRRRSHSSARTSRPAAPRGSIRWSPCATKRRCVLVFSPRSLVSGGSRCLVLGDRGPWTVD